MPYKFNGKDFDEETGLYYYGARYMNPEASVWYGVDPLAEKYTSTSAYVYCLGNPIKLADINGCDTIYLNKMDAEGNPSVSINRCAGNDVYVMCGSAPLSAKYLDEGIFEDVSYTANKNGTLKAFSSKNYKVKTSSNKEMTVTQMLYMLDPTVGNDDSFKKFLGYSPNEYEIYNFKDNKDNLSSYLTTALQQSITAGFCMFNDLMNNKEISECWNNLYEQIHNHPAGKIVGPSTSDKVAAGAYPQATFKLVQPYTGTLGEFETRIVTYDENGIK